MLPGEPYLEVPVMGEMTYILATIREFCFSLPIAKTAGFARMVGGLLEGKVEKKIHCLKKFTKSYNFS